MSVSATAYEQAINIGEDPIIMVEAINFDEADLGVFEETIVRAEEMAAARLAPYNRQRRREISRTSTIPQETKDLILLTAGVISRLHPLMRSRSAYNFMRPMYDDSQQSNVVVHEMIPLAVCAAEGTEIYFKYGEQVSGLVDQIHTPEQEFQLIRQVADIPDISADRADKVKNDIWKSAFFLEYGPHKDDSLVEALRESLESGRYDAFLLHELCVQDWDKPEVARTLAFAGQIGGDDPAWYDRLLQSPVLLSMDMQTMLAEKRAALVKGYDYVIDQGAESLGMIALGYEGNVEEEWKRIHEGLIATHMRRNKAAAQSGQRAVRAQQEPQPPRKRGRLPQHSSQSNTDTCAMIDVTDEKMAEGLTLAIATNLYDFKGGASRTATLTHKIEDYAGKNNARLQKALSEACDVITTMFNPATPVKGIQAIRNSHGLDLWELKPSLIPGLSVEGPTFRRTRVLFTVIDHTVHIIDICHRDELFRKVRALMPSS